MAASPILEFMAAHRCDFATAVASASFDSNRDGFGTWPFGEEWLWEAVASSYVPLLRLFDELGPAQTRQRLTLSLTPVLCDQLAAPGAIERCISFLRTIRPATRRVEAESLRGSGELLHELERSAAEYLSAAETLEACELRGGLARALGRHATWTSSATHAILPLLALDESIDLQLRVGVESYRQRFGQWGGGFWLPECAHAGWLHPLLGRAGIQATCVELTSRLGRNDRANLVPLLPDGGPTLVPIDRAIIDLVWGESGYPARPAYRDSHRRTAFRHQLWANDGSVYDAGRARRQAASDAREFVSTVCDRVAEGGLCVCALDAELLGHWWYEGPVWLAAVIAEAGRQRLPLTALDAQALMRHPVRTADFELPPSSWGRGGDLRTWSGPAVADLAWRSRRAELGAFAGHRPRPPARAVRELLALQSSDWAFLADRRWAGEYPWQRAEAHATQLTLALMGEVAEPRLRNLAPQLELSYS